MLQGLVTFINSGDHKQHRSHFEKGKSCSKAATRSERGSKERDAGELSTQMIPFNLRADIEYDMMKKASEEYGRTAEGSEGYIWRHLLSVDDRIADPLPTLAFW